MVSTASGNKSKLFHLFPSNRASSSLASRLHSAAGDQGATVLLPEIRRTRQSSCFPVAAGDTFPLWVQLLVGNWEDTRTGVDCPLLVCLKTSALVNVAYFDSAHLQLNDPPRSLFDKKNRTQSLCSCSLKHAPLPIAQIQQQM